MKLTLLIILVSINLFAQEPNFVKIFREIKATHTATESIKVREKYLYQMRDLEDFARLSSLEKLDPGEVYFEHYKKKLGQFVLHNVNEFMLDSGSDREQDVYAYRIVSKGYGRLQRSKLLENGLYYVNDCDDFNAFVRMAKADNYFKSKFHGDYCNGTGDIGGGFGRTFELISNLTLKEGEYKTIYLPNRMFVKKLYISASGYSSATYFDVMVNGDIKGTIYAPGRDPLYIINISDSADTINLRSMYGDANIESIKVEY